MMDKQTNKLIILHITLSSDHHTHTQSSTKRERQRQRVVLVEGGGEKGGKGK